MGDRLGRATMDDPRVVAARREMVIEQLVRRGIKDPRVLGAVTELAEPKATHRALEVGAGCGYQAAVLAELCAAVYAIEIVPELAARAEKTLAELGYANVDLKCFDGSGGWPQHAPFDVIIVSA